jgi:hypothetical protein
MTGTVAGVAVSRVALLTVLLTGFALVGGTASAVATTYCVQDPACEADGTNAPTIAAALTAAAGTGGLDRIEIGPGTFAEAGLVTAEGNPVEIVGAGVGRTVIASSGDSTALQLGDPDSSVSDLSIVLPALPNQMGLSTGGTVRRVAVTAADGMTGTGVWLWGAGSFLDGSVALPTVEGTWGVVTNPPTGATSVERSTIAAHNGIYDVNTVRQVRVTAVLGIEAVTDASPNASTTVDDALVQLAPSSWSAALRARIGGYGGSATLIARHVTVIGNGESDSEGVAAVADKAGGTSGTTHATVTVSGAILQRLGIDVLRSATGGTEPAHTSIADLTIDYSSFDPAKQQSWDENLLGGGSTSGSITSGLHNLNVTPHFRDPAAGDFSLLRDSPLIDRGSPAPLAADEPTTDLAGNPRVVDGNGDGLAISDIGAFEYVPPRLPPPAGRSAPPPPPAPLAPELADLSLVPARFAVGRDPAATATRRRHAHRVPHGTKIHFTLSRAARIAFVVERRAVGRRTGRVCVRPTRALRKAKRCTRWAVVFTFNRNGGTGPNAIPFSGRRPKGPLARGRYRLRAVASADGLSSPPRTARFAIVRGTV